MSERTGSMMRPVFPLAPLEEFTAALGPGKTTGTSTSMAEGMVGLELAVKWVVDRGIRHCKAKKDRTSTTMQCIITARRRSLAAGVRTRPPCTARQCIEGTG